MDQSLTDLFQMTETGVVSIIGAGGKTSLMFGLAKELATAGKKVLTTTTTHIFMPSPDQSPHLLVAETAGALVQGARSTLDRFTHFSAASRALPGQGKLKGFAPEILDLLWQTSLFDWIIVEADGAKGKPLKATDRHEPVVPGSTTHLIHVSGLDGLGNPLDEAWVHRAPLFSAFTGLALGAAIDEGAIASSAVREIEKAAAISSPGIQKFALLNKADDLHRQRSGEKIAQLLQARQRLDRIVMAALRDTDPIKKAWA